ncbi:unnamed protein product [Pleuronectes platessa]|uniref:Uncharacterized protein n=1 Tax=Pleuronectes platessa TaxID=8262 RepID=A0A9N7USX2_PLEPL|nr:unnamed protein product [Pleuronectes platessa]
MVTEYKMPGSGTETRVPRCVFYNVTTHAYSSSGCVTLWERGQEHITCSCDHLTYFGVLMVSAPLTHLDQEILTYISQISCSLSVIALVFTVLIFITNRKLREDVSMKILVNLAVALILLNLHFLPSHIVAAQSSTGLCLYMALFLHYSLLATFSWMALEGFHIYLLIVKVFNIYIKKYIFKLALVGWGIPAIIVALVTCVSLHHSKEFGTIDFDRAKRDTCTLLGVTTLLGLTWGLVLFSFGSLTVPGLYLFCILNSLQGVFIFLWSVMSLRKNRNTLVPLLLILLLPNSLANQICINIANVYNMDITITNTSIVVDRSSNVQCNAGSSS